MGEGINGKEFVWKLRISIVHDHGPFGKSCVPYMYRCIPRSKPMGERIDLAYLLHCNCGDYQDPRCRGNGKETEISDIAEFF